MASACYEIIWSNDCCFYLYRTPLQTQLQQISKGWRLASNVYNLSLLSRGGKFWRTMTRILFSWSTCNWGAYRYFIGFLKFYQTDRVMRSESSLGMPSFVQCCHFELWPIITTLLAHATLEKVYASALLLIGFHV